MNILALILLLFTALLVMRGAKRGLVRSVISIISMVLIMVIVSFVNPYVAEIVRDSTPVYNWAKSSAETLADEAVLELTEGTGSSSQDHDTALPSALLKALSKNNNEEVYRLLGVSELEDYVTSYVANAVTNAIAYLISFLIALVIVKLILHVVYLFAELPGVGFFNAVGGMLIGLVQALLWVWIFFIAVTVLCGTAFGQLMLRMISSSTLLSILYNNNILLHVITNIFNA